MAELNPNAYAYILPSTSQVVNRNGKPLTGGWINFYLSGTSSVGSKGTKYLSYKNWEGSLNEFNVPIDMDGRFIAIGYASNAYDIYIYDSYGNQVSSRLNVRCTSSAFINIDKTTVQNLDGTITVEKSIGNDGEDIYTLSGVESVPNINMTSSDSFLVITEDIDEETNTKTFDITVNSEAPTEKNYLNASSVIAQTTAEQYFEEFSIIDGDIPLDEEGWFIVPVGASLLDISVTLDIELVGAPSPEYETVQFRIKDKDLVTYFVESRQVDWSLSHNVLTFQAKLKDINSLMFSFTSYNHDCNVYMTVRVNDESFLTLGDMPTVVNTEVANTDGSLYIERTIDESSNTKSFDLKVLNAPLIRQPVINNTGETILKGTPVVLTGTSGESITISKLVSSTTIREQENVGVVDADILPDEEGYAVRSGEITMDTNLWTEGDSLYASTTAGVLTNLRPSKGYGLIPVGMVIKKDGINAGKVLVNPSSVPSIRQLPDVDIVDPVPNQVLSINDDGLVENRFITFIANYEVTDNNSINEEFEKGSIILCYRGYSYAEYLPLIRRIAKTSYPDPETFIYVFGAVHDGRVVEITCDPVDGWSVLETPVGGDYQLKGPWAVGVDYVMNDFCTVGDNLYICKSDYKSDPGSDDPSIDTNHWELFFSGSSSTYQLKGPWAVGVDYVMNDFCTVGDDLYICKSDYTSDSESDDPSIDNTHWELFFSGSSITGDNKVKVNATDVAGYLGDKVTAANGSLITIVYDETSKKLVFDVLGGCHEFTIVEASASITGGVATVNIEQGDLYIVDLSEETTITDIEIVLTNNASDEFPLWWFKIESGSAATLSVKIGAVEVGWLGSAITNIGLGKTIEVSVVDNVACGGELV